MKVVHSKLANDKSPDSPDDWQYFGSRLAALADIPAGGTVLDIGTGPGSVIIPAAKDIGEHGLGVAMDIDFDWFKHVIPITQEHHLNHVLFAQMDAAKLGFANRTFDRVLCGNLGWDYCFDFWMMEFIGPDTRLAEISRVLKPGGRVGISSWAGREDIDWFASYFKTHFPEYIADLEEKKGTSFRIYRENAEAYQIILKQGGFKDVKVSLETEVFVSKDEEEWWSQLWGSFLSM